MEHNRRHGNAFKGKKHTPEAIALISQKNSGKAPRWKGRTFQYDGPQGHFKMRSSYELAYAGWLDEHDISWTYEPRYKLSDGKTFSPDFQLSTGSIIEVKGFWTVIGRRKWDMFCQEYPLVEKKVLMKQDLLALNLEVK